MKLRYLTSLSFACPIVWTGMYHCDAQGKTVSKINMNKSNLAAYQDVRNTLNFVPHRMPPKPSQGQLLSRCTGILLVTSPESAKSGTLCRLRAVGASLTIFSKLPMGHTKHGSVNPISAHMN